MKCSWWLSSFVGAAFVASAAAQPGVRLTDGDATFDYAFGGSLPAQPNGPTGNVSTNFQLAGAPGAAGMNWMPNANWFYRFQGDTRERQLTAFPTGSQNLTGANEVEYVIPAMFTGGASNTLVPGATGHMHFRVDDTGLNRARLTTQFCIENTSSNALVADLFCVTNLDLLATITGDAYASLVNTGSALEWNATEGLGTARFNGPGATSAGVGVSSAIMGSMTNLTPDNFNSVGPFGPGPNAYAALQFQVTVPANTTLCVPATIDIEVTPEPTTACALLLGAIALARCRR